MTETQTTHSTSGITTPSTTAKPSRLLLTLLTALSVLPVNVILPSLPHIAASLRTDVVLVNLSVALYAVATAVTEIIAGAISDRYGRRPVALASIAIFTIASLGCALATTLAAFLIFRVLQASIATCFSISLVMIKETSNDYRAASRFGYLAMGWALAPMLAPFLGGTLDAAFGWRSIFITLSCLGAASFALSIRLLKETAQPSSPHRQTLAFYRQVLPLRRFWAYALCKAFAMGTLYIFLAGAPIAAAGLLGGSTAALGLCMGLVPAGFMLGSFLAGRFGAAFPPGPLILAARLLTVAGLVVGLGLAIAGIGGTAALFGPCVFIGIGNGLTMPAANAGLLSIRQELAGTIAGLAAATSIAGGAVIVAAAGPFFGGTHPVQTLFAVLLAPAILALLMAMIAAILDRPQG